MKYSNIGGQAVMEGVMMRNAEKWAVAVRTADQQITVKTGIYKGVIPSKTVGKIPILRGVCSFIDSLYLGMKTLNRRKNLKKDCRTSRRRRRRRRISFAQPERRTRRTVCWRKRRRRQRRSARS